MYGAHAPVSSFVVRPTLDADLLDKVKAEVLRGALPAPDESTEALVQRLARCTAFDDPRITYGKRTRHGFFKHQTALPTRQGGQTRRATYAEQTQPAFRNEAGDLVTYLRGYKHLYRHREDQFICRPMPPSLRNLRDALYAQVPDNVLIHVLSMAIATALIPFPGRRSHYCQLNHRSSAPHNRAMSCSTMKRSKPPRGVIAMPSRRRS